VWKEPLSRAGRSKSGAIMQRIERIHRLALASNEAVRSPSRSLRRALRLGSSRLRFCSQCRELTASLRDRAVPNCEQLIFFASHHYSELFDNSLRIFSVLWGGDLGKYYDQLLGCICRGELTMMNKETAKVYEILTNVACKVLIVLVMLGSWVALLVCLILKPSVYLVVASTILPLTLVIILKHYFK
jgi:hypothetical protein